MTSPRTSTPSRAPTHRPRHPVALTGRELDPLRAAHDQLTAAVSDLAGSDGWARMLRVAALFHHYSPNNVLLITAQRPDATAVAGFGTWRHLGRQVRRGEHGIVILAPVRARSTTPTTPDRAGQAPTEPVGSDRTPDSAGPRGICGFRAVHVFDISQTEGPDLPAGPAPEQLDGQAPAGLWDGLAAHVAAEGFALTRGDCGAANGVTDYTSNTVIVADRLPPAQAVKTLAHELGHVLLHRPDVRPDGFDRPRAEVEAESVAYIVTHAHGLRSEAYTVPYVTGWAGGDVELLRATADRVLRTAATILRDTPPQTPPALQLADGVDLAALVRAPEEAGRQRTPPSLGLVTVSTLTSQPQAVAVTTERPDRLAVRW